ncbi:hypothetical protein FA95DRAFT_227039 [Auriscalpium vulgare]|uniref:Uncharacterized protein n=1 Tax=Auriscalpium vulgare TaxID=40419 RepID=A0ACB8RKI7_9AGAM|nr:hypothetical protein FA95DRAFT_227039 [Auriscalpium vulgare]
MKRHGAIWIRSSIRRPWRRRVPMPQTPPLPYPRRIWDSLEAGSEVYRAAAPRLDPCPDQLLSATATPPSSAERHVPPGTGGGEENGSGAGAAATGSELVDDGACGEAGSADALARGPRSAAGRGTRCAWIDCQGQWARRYLSPGRNRRRGMPDAGKGTDIQDCREWRGHMIREITSEHDRCVPERDWLARGPPVTRRRGCSRLKAGDKDAGRRPAAPMAVTCAHSVDVDGELATPGEALMHRNAGGGLGDKRGWNAAIGKRARIWCSQAGCPPRGRWARHATRQGMQLAPRAISPAMADKGRAGCVSGRDWNRGAIAAHRDGITGAAVTIISLSPLHKACED